jgi:hypothetical protein
MTAFHRFVQLLPPSSVSRLVPLSGMHRMRQGKASASETDSVIAQPWRRFGRWTTFLTPCRVLAPLYPAVALYPRGHRRSASPWSLTLTARRRTGAVCCFPSVYKRISTNSASESDVLNPYSVGVYGRAPQHQHAVQAQYGRVMRENERKSSPLSLVSALRMRAGGWGRSDGPVLGGGSDDVRTHRGMGGAT